MALVGSDSSPNSTSHFGQAAERHSSLLPTYDKILRTAAASMWSRPAHRLCASVAPSKMRLIGVYSCTCCASKRLLTCCRSRVRPRSRLSEGGSTAKRAATCSSTSILPRASCTSSDMSSISSGLVRSGGRSTTVSRTLPIRARVFASQPSASTSRSRSPAHKRRIGRRRRQPASSSG